MSDLFNNPMVESARKALKKEDLNLYKRSGEIMYSDVNMNQMVSEDPDKCIENALVEIRAAVLSGLSKDSFSNEEQNTMEDAYGNDWYEHILKKK